MRYEPRHAGEGTSTTNTTRYLHTDHLGSVVVITSETGAVVESLAYDAWGKRRPATTWQTPTPGVFMAAITLTRGFTMHEHLDQVGLIHMGGRVYDPEIGRFLSPDPFVQFPFSTQGFNRYAYVNNNPLLPFARLLTRVTFAMPSGSGCFGVCSGAIGSDIIHSVFIQRKFCNDDITRSRWP